MAEIYNFDRNEKPMANGELLFKILSNDWNIVRFTNSEALIKDCKNSRMSSSVIGSLLSKFDSEQNDFLALRDPQGFTTILLLVNKTTKWIVEYYILKENDKLISLKLLSPVIAENHWSMNQDWSDQLIISSDGKVHHINALPNFLSVYGNLYIHDCDDVSLPQTLFVFGRLSFHSTIFNNTPNYITCLHLDIEGCSLPIVSDRLKVQGNLRIKASRLSKLANSAIIIENLNIEDMVHEFKMPDTLRVSGNFNAETTKISDFGKDTIILGNLNIPFEDIYKPFALDFSGRIIRYGDDISIIDTPINDDVGIPIQVRKPAGTPAKFYGEFSDWRYNCLIIDNERDTVHMVTPLRHSVVSKVEKHMFQVS